MDFGHVAGRKTCAAFEKQGDAKGDAVWVARPKKDAQLSCLEQGDVWKSRRRFGSATFSRL
jgi:hypothetical protein